MVSLQILSFYTFITTISSNKIVLPNFCRKRGLQRLIWLAYWWYLLWWLIQIMTFAIILQYNTIKKSRFPHHPWIDKHAPSRRYRFFLTMGRYARLWVSIVVYRCYERLWVHECLWVSMGDLCVIMGLSMEVYRYLWVSMGVNNCLWVSLGTSWVLRPYTHSSPDGVDMDVRSQ